MCWISMKSALCTHEKPHSTNPLWRWKLFLSEFKRWSTESCWLWTQNSINWRKYCAHLHAKCTSTLSTNTTVKLCHWKLFEWNAKDIIKWLWEIRFFFLSNFKFIVLEWNSTLKLQYTEKSSVFFRSANVEIENN